MQCFTVFNDLKPYRGINLSPNGTTGVLGDFCTLGDDDYPLTPHVINGLGLIRHLRILVPQAGWNGVILEADIIQKPLTKDFPILVFPKTDTEHDHALVYWAIDLTLSQSLVRSLYGEVAFFKDTIIHPPYYEVIFSMKPFDLAVIFFEDNTGINLHWSGSEMTIKHRELKK